MDLVLQKKNALCRKYVIFKMVNHSISKKITKQKRSSLFKSSNTYSSCVLITLVNSTTIVLPVYFHSNGELTFPL